MELDFWLYDFLANSLGGTTSKFVFQFLNLQNKCRNSIKS